MLWCEFKPNVISPNVIHVVCDKRLSSLCASLCLPPCRLPVPSPQSAQALFPVNFIHPLWCSPNTGHLSCAGFAAWPPGCCWLLHWALATLGTCQALCSPDFCRIFPTGCLLSHPHSKCCLLRAANPEQPELQVLSPPFLNALQLLDLYVVHVYLSLPLRKEVPSMEGPDLIHRSFPAPGTQPGALLGLMTIDEWMNLAHSSSAGIVYHKWQVPGSLSLSLSLSSSICFSLSQEH